MWALGLLKIMADIIQDSDIERLVSCANNFISEDINSPIQIIKKVMVSENCSLAEAKEAYLLAENNESLGEYQERVILPLIEEFEEHESLNEND